MSPIQEGCVCPDSYYSHPVSILASLSLLEFQERSTDLVLPKSIDSKMYNLQSSLDHNAADSSGWKSLFNTLRKLCRSKPGTKRRISKVPRAESKEQSSTPLPITHEKILELPASSNCSITPQVQQALVVARKGEYELSDSYQIPTLQNDDEVMIRNYAVGLNPIDWKSVEYNFCLPGFPWVRPQ
jgi:hypothetical protein